MESKQILIDTSILIDHLRKTNKSKSIFYKLSTNYECKISSITQFEFLVGITSQNRDYIMTLLSALTVLPFDSKCVQSAIDIYRTLKDKNQLIPVADIFIAATAIANSLPIESLNRKHFERIEELTFADF